MWVGSWLHGQPTNGSPPPPRLSLRSGYLLAYNLLQFCGHSWMLANIVTRLLRFGGGSSPAFSTCSALLGFMASVPTDGAADTFYSVGLAACLCQLFSVLELYHIADGLEKARLLPRFIQV